MLQCRSWCLRSRRRCTRWRWRNHCWKSSRRWRWKIRFFLAFAAFVFLRFLGFFLLFLFLLLFLLWFLGFFLVRPLGFLQLPSDFVPFILILIIVIWFTLFWTTLRKMILRYTPSNVHFSSQNYHQMMNRAKSLLKLFVFALSLLHSSFDLLQAPSEYSPRMRKIKGASIARSSKF